jgi:hypothetical protein
MDTASVNVYNPMMGADLITTMAMHRPIDGDHCETCDQ